MTVFVEVKTSELRDKALDYMTAKAAGIPMFEMWDNWPGNAAVTEATRVDPAVICDLKWGLHFEASLRSVLWSPSTDWSQGGPLIDKHQLDLTFERKGLMYAYQCQDDGLPIIVTEDSFGSFGSTHLIAACRPIVAAKLGDTVSIPAELVTQ